MEPPEEHAEEVGVGVSPLFLMLIFDLFYLGRLTTLLALIHKHLFHLTRLLPPTRLRQLRGKLRRHHQKLWRAYLRLEINRGKCQLWSVWLHAEGGGVVEALRIHLEMRIVEEFLHGVCCLNRKHFLGVLV